jgi:hypothetical protein
MKCARIRIGESIKKIITRSGRRKRRGRRRLRGAVSISPHGSWSRWLDMWLRMNANYSWTRDREPGLRVIILISQL